MTDDKEYAALSGHLIENNGPIKLVSVSGGVVIFKRLSRNKGTTRMMAKACRRQRREIESLDLKDGKGVD